MSWNYFPNDKLYSIFGVDLSAHNRYNDGSHYDWDLLVSRIGFIFFRCLWRQYDDADYDYHVGTVKNQYPDLPWGTYQWVGVKKSSTNMKKQFDALRRQIDAHGMPPLGIFLDIEENPDAMTKTEFGDQLAKYYNWCFAEWGSSKMGTYTSTYYWERFLGSGNAAYKTDYPKRTKLMIARYAQVPAPDYQYRLPADWADVNHPLFGLRWHLWQNSADGNNLGNDLKKGFPSFGIHSYDIDTQRFPGDREKFKQVFGVYPKPITNPLVKEGAEPPPPPPPPPPSPPEEVKKVRIKGLLPNETLNMRSIPWGNVCAMTWNGEEFSVMSTVEDNNQRDWYQVGQNIYIASWYTEAI